jgi:hypothetical protein
MKSIHRRTLLAIFSDPMARSLQWRQIEMLFLAIGAQLVEDADRACASMLGDAMGTFHRPHPAKDAKPYQIRDARTFLRNAGFDPEKGMRNGNNDLQGLRGPNRIQR